MPIMPNGKFMWAHEVEADADTLRAYLLVAARTGNTLHPAALEWKRRLAECEAVIKEFNDARIAQGTESNAAA